ncbi:tetratricopeptide repeat protein [uncultured Polaribacter sp.]|uniref:tetratricopeptide repeat protein n=1 Tax=uncultured Polaribacter sp. TaxID=174711 RepID=UPI003703F2BD
MQNRKETILKFLKRSLFSLLFFLISLKSYTQDSLSVAIDFTEEKELKFQQFFFTALSQKSIGNYQKAIENLESCNQILPNNKSVFFEFSKNYLYLNNTLLAKEYINRAINQDSKNTWMQKHLVKVLEKENNFFEAIKIQQKIIVLNPKENKNLVLLYLKNRDYKKALSFIKTLEEDNLLSSDLRRIKERLEKTNYSETQKVRVSKDIYKRFETEKTYTVLKQILIASKDKPKLLLKFCKEGIALFPAQPFVYLINGSTLNVNKEFKKALEILQNGIDFVIEDAMEVLFYKEIALAYKGLNNKVEERRYMEKYRKLVN